MTPEQKVRHLIVLKMIAWGADTGTEPITAENIDEIYDALDDTQDAISEVRAGQVETEVPAPYSRHYEASSVAAQLPDGSWVGWTYWYGGGKHAEPEAIEWMSEAYDLNVTEEQKMVTVRTFTKVEAA